MGEARRDQLERLTWSLWHGQVDKALGKIDDLETAMEPVRETDARFHFSRQDRALVARGPRTINHSVEQLLLSIAVGIDEGETAGSEPLDSARPAGVTLRA